MTSRSYGGDKIVIADQDSTPLVGNTLHALVFAATTGANFIEQHLVMTKDDHLVALNDLYLGDKTNVVSLFPERKREDGNYYVIDFNLAELQQLSRSGFDFEASMDIRIPSFEDILILIGKLEKELGTTIGIYPEIKHPWFHLREGKDISSIILQTLKRFGYSDIEDAVFLGCHDAEELQRIHKTLMPALDMDLQLVQLIDLNDGTETKYRENNDWVAYNYDWMFTQSGLKVITSYADAIGLKHSLLLDDQGNLKLENYTSAIQRLGMQLHVSGIQQETVASSDESGFDQLLELVYFTANAEAISTGNWIGTQHFLETKRNNVAKATDKLKTETEGSSPLNTVDLESESSTEPRETTTQL